MQSKTISKALCSIFIITTACSINAAPVSQDTAAMAARNWPKYVGLSELPRDVREIFAAPEVGSEVAWIVLYEGGGWAIAAGDDLLLPVYAFSLTEKFPEDDIGPAIREILGIMNRISETVKAYDIDKRTELAAARKTVWLEVLSGSGPKQSVNIMGPLCSSDWYQRHAYNEQCPLPPPPIVCGDIDEPSDECNTGCVATAMSQIMYYWRHPAGYDWANMRDQVWLTSPQVQINAVSQLCHDAGVSVFMDYCGQGDCQSWAYDRDVDNALEGPFGYYTDATLESANTSDLYEEIDFLRPVYVHGTSHAWVCDGYDISGGPVQFHWKMGWDGVNDVWATLDQIPGGGTYEEHVRWIAPVTVQFVGASNPGDGSPNDPYENIEQAKPNYADGATLIFKAGSDNTFAVASLVLDRPCTLKGYQSVIRKE